MYSGYEINIKIDSSTLSIFNITLKSHGFFFTENIFFEIWPGESRYKICP